MKTLYLVDGSGYIFRAYYATPQLSNSNGLPTNAVFGFTRMLVRLLKETEAEHMAVAFDTKKPTFRHEMYDLYKANRSECPQDLLPQMPYFRRVVEVLGVPMLEREGFEADDIIATLADKFRADVERLVVVSGDKDLTQLVDEKVEVWDPMRDRRYSPKAVLEKFGVLPTQMGDFLAISGDSSDNIPGVKGVGPKSAVKLLDCFGTLDKILEDTAQIENVEGLRGKSSVRKKFDENLEGLAISRKLVALAREVEPFYSEGTLEDYQIQLGKVESASELFSELEFSSIPDIMEFISNGRGVPASEEAATPDVTTIVDSDNFLDFVSLLTEQGEFAFDTETTSLDPKSCSLLGISFSWDDEKAYYLPVESQVEPARALDLERVRRSLGPIFSNPQVKKHGLNLKYDYQALVCQGFEVSGLSFDCMVASSILHADGRSHGLKSLSSRMLGYKMKTYEEVLGECETLSQVPLDTVARYAGDDALISWKLVSLLKEEFSSRELDGGVSPESLFYQVEMPLVAVLGEMELCGIGVDSAFLSELDDSYVVQLEKLTEQIFSLAGIEFNLNSPKQLSEVLFEILGLPTVGIKKTKTYYSTNASTLKKLSLNHEIAQLVWSYRELHKLKSTYTSALVKLIHPQTQRIHSSFNQAVTSTGRLSSSEPNLQNIPIRGERGREIRRAFVAKPGSVFISADYSQIELRVLAHMADAETLRQAFLSGEDIHEATAREMFGDSEAHGMSAGDQRRLAKTINFGVIYGISAFRLAEQLGISRNEAQEFIDKYFAKYPGVLEYFDTIERLLSEKGYSQTMYGRRRYLSEIDSSGRDRGYALRSLINFPIQGSAAEIIKFAMLNLQQELAPYRGRADLILQVHDELVIEVDKALQDEIRQIIVDQMEQAVELAIPLKVDVSILSTWGDEK